MTKKDRLHRHMLRCAPVIVNAAYKGNRRVMMFEPRKKAFLLIPSRGAGWFRQLLCAFLRVGLIGVFLSQTVYASASEVERVHFVQEKDHAKVNWTLGRLEATGSASPRTDLPDMAKIRKAAEQAARSDALAHMMGALMDLQLTAKLLGRRHLVKPEVRLRVERMLKQCDTESTRYYAGGGVDVVVGCMFAGGLAATLLPTVSRAVSGKGGKKTYTGLIVDATSARIRPVLVPTIQWRDGEDIWGPELVSAEAIRLRGGVRYVTSMDRALAHEAAGAQPLVVHYTRKTKAGHWLVTSKHRASLATTDQSFLRNGRIVVVVLP
ncbi:MAG: hypothetical protein KTR25_04600 [Myxococcales bacterium]|nr:hypothetical protein [Myxococcales bacterium]